MAETAKLNVRMPPELRQSAGEVAQVLGVSLNAFVVHAVANWTNYQAGRLRAGKPVGYAPTPAEASAAASRVGVVTELPSMDRAGSRVPRVGANQPCPCGSGQKYKRCHGKP